MNPFVFKGKLMKLQLLDAIGEITEARTAAGLWQQGQGCSLTGLSGAAKTVFLAALDRLLPEQGSLVFLLSGETIFVNTAGR